jgi:hypothetical protein
MENIVEMRRWKINVTMNENMLPGKHRTYKIDQTNENSMKS